MGGIGFRRRWAGLSIRLAVLAGVASAVPASPLLLAQAPSETTTTVVEANKAVGAKAAPKAEVKVQAAQKVVVRQAGIAPAAANQLARHFVQQFRPALRAEYHFIRNICNPTADQRKALARAGEKVLREVATNSVQARNRPMQVRNGRAVYPDPRKMIEEGMATAVATILTPEQAARFKAESEARAADRRQAAAKNLVAGIDQELVLADDQREKLAAAILDRWDDAWCQSLETLTYGNQYHPWLPDEVIVPFLDDRQKTLWRATSSNRSIMNGFVGNLLPQQDDPAEDAELIEARVEAEKQHGEVAPGAAGIPNAIPLRIAPAVKLVAPPPAAPPAPRPAAAERKK